MRQSLLLAGWAALATLVFAGSAAAAAKDPIPARCDRFVTIDAGHEPSAQGAVSAGGTPEYTFNWRLAEDLAASLKEAGWKTGFLVRHGENISLSARAARIARLGHGTLVSIHHDSVQPQFLVRRANTGEGGPLSLHARGYSLFVKTDGSAAAASLALARAIGRELQQVPLKPNPSHAEHIAGENRAWVDRKLGIYAFNGLAVLRASHIPAVLIETAVIVNPLDEAWISKPANRQAFARAIVSGLESTCGESAAPDKAVP